MQLAQVVPGRLDGKEEELAGAAQGTRALARAAIACLPRLARRMGPRAVAASDSS